MSEQFTDPVVLQEKLAEILIMWPLYRNFYYPQQGCHKEHSHLQGTRYAHLPIRLHMFCDNALCNKETWWQARDTEVRFGNMFINRASYTCKNCESNQFYYLFVWQEKDKGTSGLFMNVGQYPPLPINPSADLTKALGKEDAELYKKALISANFSHGIGAVAYFRRVLENKINLLLDLIGEAAKNADISDKLLKELEAVKSGRVVEDRIAFAAKLLPAHLKPGGHNPLDKLYAMASAGLHGESDEDCLTIFAEGRFVFEYLFKNLTVGNEEAREYVRQLSSPSPVKTSKQLKT